jgi:hypothetical protein
MFDLGPFYENLLTNFLGSFISSALLVFILFLINEKFFNVQISGVWSTRVNVDSSNTIKDYELDFVLNLLQKGNEIVGYGEKIAETDPKGKTYRYETSKRVKLEINGCIKKKYFGKSEIYLVIKEFGRIRESGTVYKLKYMRKKHLVSGIFWSTAANSRGKVIMNYVSESVQ